MYKIARLIITLDCNRKCSYCCNTPKVLDSATRIDSLSALKDYDEICITGGEPLLYPNKVIKISKALKTYKNRIYLYTAISNDLRRVMDDGCIDGVHFTLHESGNIIDFYNIQSIAETDDCYHNDISFRAFILKNVPYSTIMISPNVWARLEIKDWIKDCLLPKNETLFILESNNEEVK